MGAAGAKAAQVLPGMLTGAARAVPETIRNSRHALIEGILKLATPDMGTATAKQKDDVEKQKESFRKGLQVATLLAPLGGIAEPAAAGVKALEQRFVKPWEKHVAGTPRVQRIDQKFRKESEGGLPLGKLLTDPEAVGSAIGTAGASLIPMAVAPGSTAGYVLGSVMEAGGALRDIERYEEETGKSLAPAKKAATVALTGAISGTLERFGFEVATGKLAEFLPKQFRKGFMRAASQAVQGAVGEIGTEEAQTVAANVLQQLLVDPAQEWNEGWKEALIGAAGAGGGAGLATGAGRSMDVAERAKRMKARERWRGEEAPWSLDAEDGGKPVPADVATRTAARQEQHRPAAPASVTRGADDELSRVKTEAQALDAQVRGIKSGMGMPTHEPGLVSQADLDAIKETVRGLQNPATVEESLARLKSATRALDARALTLKSGMGMPTKEPRPQAEPAPVTERSVPAQSSHRPISVDRLLGAQALPEVVEETDAREAPVRAARETLLEENRKADMERLISRPSSALDAILDGPQRSQRPSSDAPGTASPAERFETPEEADQTFLSGLGLSEEQARELRTRMPVTDDVTGYATARHHGPALERAQQWAERTGRPAQYVEIDIHNLGGMNATLGHSGADRVVRQITDAVRREFPDEGGKRVAFIRHGGDELSLVATGYTEEEVEVKMTRAKTAVQNVIRSAGLHDIPHAKGATDEVGRERRRGGGIFWGTAPIEPGVPLSRTRSVADFAVEARKFTRRADDVDRKQAVPSRNTPGPRPGGDAAQDRGGRESRPGGSPESAPGERAPAVRAQPAPLTESAQRGPAQGVGDDARAREAFRKRHGEDPAGLERFLSLADAVRQEAADATPEEVHEAALALFDQARRLDARPAVDPGAGEANPGAPRGRQAAAEGARRPARAPKAPAAPRPVARSFSRPPDPSTRGISVRELTDVVERAENAWPAAPEIAVVLDESDLPLEVQASLRGAKVRGVYHGGRHGAPGTGTVYLLAGRVGSMAEAFETLVHEVVGHAGVMAVLGQQGWKDTVNGILESREGKLLVEEWRDARGREYSFDLTSETGRESAVGETLAWIAERKLSDPTYRPPSFYGRLVARIRLWLRGIGRRFGVTPDALGWNEADVDALLARAARQLEGPTEGEGAGTWLSKRADDGEPEAASPLSEAQRRRVAELVSKTRERLAETDPRWQELAEDLAEEQEEDLANAPPARPDLANPGVEPKGRRLVDRVDRARKDEDEPAQRADAEVNAEADRRLEADWEGERQALLSRGRQGAGLNDVETVTAKKIISAEAFGAMKSGDVETLAETAELIDAYRRTGTEQARAFRQRRDEVMSPRERLAAFVAEAVLRPGDATAEKVRTGTPSQRRRALQRHGEEAKGLLERLRKRGVDVANLSDEDLSDRFLVARVVREVAAARADLSDKVFEYWANSILSGPLTHIANVTGNTISLAIEYGFQQPLEMALGSAVGGTRSLAEGRALYGALWRGVVRGSRNAVEAFQTEQRALGEKGDPLAPDRLEARVAIGGKAGRVIRTPYRFLRAADEFYRGIIGEMEAAATAHGMARKEGLSGEAFAARLQELLEDGESAAWQAASDRADLLTFQRELGEFGRLILSARRKVPGLRYILPFVTTPANIFKTAIQKSPAGAVGSLWRATRGELSKDEAIRASAEQLIGLGVVALLAQGLGGGEDDEEALITGTVPFKGSRKGERDLAERTAPPLSVRFGGKWYGYGRLEPLATWLGLTVDGLRGVTEAREGRELDEVLATTLKRFVAQLEDKTFLDGVGRIIRAIDDGRSAARVVGDVAGGFVPAALRQPAQAREGKVRETRAWGSGPSPKHEGERYESRLARRIAERAAPFATEGTPRVNAYGVEVEKPNRTFLGRLLSPVQRLHPAMLPADVRDIDAAFVLWNKSHPDAPFYPPIPEPRYTVGGRTFYLTDDEYRRLLVLTGSVARRDLNDLVQRTSGVLGEEDLEEARRVFRKAAKAARERLKGRRAGGVDDREGEP